MSEEILTQDREVVRSYRAPWKGQLVLVCRKCQKKLKHGGKKNAIAKLGKALKKRARNAEDGLEAACHRGALPSRCAQRWGYVCTQRQLELESAPSFGREPMWMRSLKYVSQFNTRSR